mmetsp:Transcript_22579/g.53310  ORF Transcript_22579/g.53310 Transcript_22579/m.53310 type:complete len:369 (+) Transcript_22579:193-1299(+)
MLVVDKLSVAWELICSLVDGCPEVGVLKPYAEASHNCTDTSAANDSSAPRPSWLMGIVMLILRDIRIISTLDIFSRFGDGWLQRAGDEFCTCDTIDSDTQAFFWRRKKPSVFDTRRWFRWRRGCVTREKAIDILDHTYADINADESRVYRMKSDEVATARDKAKFAMSTRIHPADFRHSLTYGEVEPDSVSDVLIPLLDLGPSDVFYDLGCGTGKIPIQVALQTNCKASKGIEIMHDRVQEGRKALECLRRNYHSVFWKNDRVVIAQGDLQCPPSEADLSDATVLFINNVCFDPALMQVVMGILDEHPKIRRVVTLRKLCERHRERRCAAKGYACCHFIHPPPETCVSVSWAHDTTAFLYIRKQFVSM